MGSEVVFLTGCGEVLGWDAALLRVRGWALSWGARGFEAGDIASLLLEKAWQRSDRRPGTTYELSDEPIPLPTLLDVHGAVRDHHESAQKRVALWESAPPPRPLALDPVEAAECAEAREAIPRLVTRLLGRVRRKDLEAAALFLEDFTFEEIAARLGRDPPYWCRRVQRVCRHLCSLLGKASIDLDLVSLDPDLCRVLRESLAAARPPGIPGFRAIPPLGDPLTPRMDGVAGVG